MNTNKTILFAEFQKYTPADEQYYRNLRDDSPQSDISANSGAAIGYSMINNGKHTNKHHVNGDGESKVTGSAKKTAKIRIKKNSISSLNSSEMPQATLMGYNNYG